MAATRRQEGRGQQLAQRLGGRLVDSGLHGESLVEIPLAGRTARVESFRGSRYSDSYTRVVVRLPRSPGTLHILPEGFGRSFLSRLGDQDLSIGDAQFDFEYVLKAHPPTLIRGLFHPDRRDQVMASVRRLNNLRDATIDLDRNQLTVQCREHLTDQAGLQVMLQTAEDFLKYLFESTPEAGSGIQWSELTVRDGGECPVCGTAMGHQVLRCEACRTPHHAECWAYMGRCSTYACKGTRAVA
jgi:hypothetical protein